MKLFAIVPAAGSGARYKTNQNKLFENLKGMPVIAHTLMSVASNDNVDGIIVCTSLDVIDDLNKIILQFKIPKIKKVILGGKTRQESVFKGLTSLEDETPDLVLIHDGARPILEETVLNEAITCAKEFGSAVVAVPTKDTIKRVSENTIIETLNRNELWNIQTPQIFKYAELLDAHKTMANEEVTDDSALMEKMGYKIKISKGSYKNIKITTVEDLAIASFYIENI